MGPSPKYISNRFPIFFWWIQGSVAGSSLSCMPIYSELPHRLMVFWEGVYVRYGWFGDQQVALVLTRAFFFVYKMGHGFTP